jgi:ribosomal protein S6E (S10)
LLEKIELEVENEKLGITGGNDEEMEREVRSERKVIQLITG